MASKDEYYQRIIASLQTDITSQKSQISDLKSTVDRQQKEIEALKASHNTPQKSSQQQQERISTEHLLLAVKLVCDDVIRTNYEQLPTIFADKPEFESFRRLAEQKFLLAETFSEYKKSLEVRMKSIEERLGTGFCLLAINLYSQKGKNTGRCYFNLNKIINIHNLQWLYPILICSLIGMLAIYLISSIND